jgi:FixJ family two-component response regulator
MCGLTWLLESNAYDFFLPAYLVNRLGKIDPYGTPNIWAPKSKSKGVVMTTPFIMLVDDEVSFVETMAKRLAKRDIKALKSYSGEECLEKLKATQNLDVIVLDIKMPGMDGIETLKEIKKLTPLTEVIILTGHATVELAIDGMKLGASDFLKKPLDIEELVEKVTEAAQKKRAQEEKIDDWQSFMKTSTLEELMVPLAEYATVSEDANILEAIHALETAQKAFDPKRYRHRAVIVVDKQKHVVGKLSQHDIIQAMEPQYKETQERKKGALDHLGFGRKFIETVSHQFSTWDKPLQNLYQKAIGQKVKSFMYKPTEGEYISISANMDEIIHQLIIGKHHSLLVTNGTDIVGIVRLTDVFEFIRLRLKTMHLAILRNDGEGLDETQ